MKKLSQTSMPHNLIIIQARVSSTRLPGKVLRPIWEGLNLLDLQLDKLRDCGPAFVLATTDNTSDDAIVSWADQNQVEVFRGDENNVLKRFIDCAKVYGAENLIRVCSDNPFIQLGQVHDFLKALENGFDYICLCDDSGTPAIKTHWGLFVEGVKLSALEKVSELLESNPQKSFYAEHVTNFIYGNSDQFKVKLEIAPEVIVSRNDLRFTIDTEEDFDTMTDLLELLDGNQKELEELVSTTDKHPYFLTSMQRGIKSFIK